MTAIVSKAGCVHGSRPSRLQRVVNLAMLMASAAMLACGGASSSAPAPAPSITAPTARAPEDPWAYLPGDVAGIVAVRGQRLRSSPYFAALEPVVRSSLAGSESVAFGGVTLESADLDELLTAELLVGGQRLGAGGEAESVLAMVGGVQGAALQGLLVRIAGRSTPPLTVESGRYEGVEFWQVGGLRVVEPHPGLVVAATGAAVETILQTAAGRAGSDARSMPGLAGLCRELGCEDATVFGYAHLAATGSLRLVRGTRGVLSPNTVEGLEHIAIRLEADDGLSLTSLATGPGAEAAGNEVRSRTAGLLDGMQGMMLRALGLHVVIEALRVEQQAGRVRVALELTDAQTRGLIERVDALRSFASGFGEGS